MNGRTISAARGLEILARIILGAVFVYAGAVKVSAPQPLADSIASFSILPRALIVPLALGLPPFEMASGVLVLIGRPRRVGALAVLIVTAVFLAALGSALARGITVDCGCFGPGTAAGTRAKMWLDFGRDAALIAGAAFLYARGRLSRQPDV
jgi:uncharacterized membrane protein YphA (DoxX/SURF4 family)